MRTSPCPCPLRHGFLVVGGHEEGHGGAGGAGGRLDDMGHVALAGGLVEVLQPLARVGCVLPQVVVGAVGDAFELVPAPREQELHVARPHRVVRQLVLVVRPQPQHALGDPQVAVPGQPLGAPVLVPARSLVRRHEVLHLHLLELAGAEHEVAGRDLVAERLADLGDAERRPLARGLQDVLEVGEHALGRLRPQVDLGAARPSTGPA